MAGALSLRVGLSLPQWSETGNARVIGPRGAATIEAQHATLARQGPDLMRDLESAARGEGLGWDPKALSWESVALNVRLYSERLRHNMAVEERVLFPTALRHLEATDWRAIGHAWSAYTQDPLLRLGVDERFVELHRAIVAEAHRGSDDTRH